MGFQGPKAQEWFQRAEKVIPYGVNSNFRYWGKDDTLVLKGGEGAYVWDTDDKKYIDYRLGFGPVILGHAHPAVIERVQEALSHGNVFAMTTIYEVSLCERIVRMCNVDKVRITNTGSEATMHALRIARARTGREKYIKFEGTYHGQADYFMYSSSFTPVSTLGTSYNPTPVPTTSGIPRVLNEYIYCLPFNDAEKLEELIEAKWHDLAAVFVEPMIGNLSGMMPKPGFLEKIRELCDKYGIMMIMDEVKTGFRIANGGAQEYFGVQADLVTYAKAMGNGFPVAAFAGKEDIMMTIEPGHVAHGGTYSGQTVGAAAADATLELMENNPVIDTIFTQGQSLIDGIEEILGRADLPFCVTGVPSMFGIVLGTEEAPADYRSYISAADLDLYVKLWREWVQRGVMPAHFGQEPWYMSYSHGDEIVADTLTAFEDAVKTVKKAN